MTQQPLKLWLTLNSDDAEKLEYENPKVSDDLGYIILGIQGSVTAIEHVSAVTDGELLSRVMERIPKLTGTLDTKKYEVLRIERAVIIRPKSEATDG